MLPLTRIECTVPVSAIAFRSDVDDLQHVFEDYADIQRSVTALASRCRW
jgi:hypothetical protein